MDKKFKITMPGENIKPEVLKQKIKKFFSDDMENGQGILSKVFIFTYQNQPISITDLTRKINDYYKTDVDRSLVFRSADKLVEKNLLCKATSGYVLSIPPKDQKPIHKKIIETFHRFLGTIPLPFRNRYQIVNYLWIANGQGLDYIEWCCKLLNFEVKVGK